LMQKYFSRKIFNFRSLFKDVFYLMSSLPEFGKLKKNKDIPDTFREKIMTVVSAVNGCVYCIWFHAKVSVKSGIPSKEVKQYLGLQFGTIASDFEINALLFAQHYAETNRNPDDEMLKIFFEFYGDKTARHIILIIRMIFFGNLYGNTLDAFISRIKGLKAEKSNVLFEFFFFFFNFPVYVLLKLMSKK
jgi:AhpD family alkylhydroperoxidase